MKMIQLARPILTYGFVLIATVASSSVSLAVQSDAPPVFPTELKHAIQDASLSQTESARRAGQAIRQGEERRMRRSVLIGSEQPAKSANKFVSSRHSIASAPIRSSQASTLSEAEKNQSDSEWFGTVMTIPDGETCSGAKIVVHPPISNGTNQYTFSVENLGAASSESFTVDFTTPDDVRVLQVFPFTASASDHSVSVKFEGLEAHTQSKIHIKTTSATKGKFDFQAKVHMEKIQAFQVATTPTATKPRAKTKRTQSSKKASASTVASAAKPEPYKLASTTQKLEPINEPVVKTEELQIEIVPNSANGHSATSDAKYKLTTSLSGPKTLASNREYDFEIFVSNTTNDISTEIIIQLNLPPGLMITNLDRQAWVNQEQRTVSWKVSPLEVGMTETITYRIKTGETEGDQIQSIVVGMANRLEGHIELKSEILNMKTTTDETASKGFQ